MTLMILVFLAFVRSHFPPATDVRVMDAESVIGFALLLLISVLLYTWRAARPDHYQPMPTEFQVPYIRLIVSRNNMLRLCGPDTY